MKTILLIAVFIALACERKAEAQSYAIDWFSIDGGGGNSSGGSYALSGTIAQPDTAALSDGNYTLQGGFWSVIAVIQTQGAPFLKMVRSGGNIILSWLNDSVGFVLDETASLATPIKWQAVSQEPVVANGEKTVTLSVMPGNKFYRLKRP